MAESTEELGQNSCRDTEVAQRSIFNVVPLFYCSEKLYKDTEFELLCMRKMLMRIQYDTVPYSQSFKRKENVLPEIHRNVCHNVSFYSHAISGNFKTAI